MDRGRRLGLWTPQPLKSVVSGDPRREVSVNGGALVAEVLKAHGVPFVFTLCGGHISPILVGAKERGIRVVDVRHEVNAVFAADAVARLTGVPGVAAVTAGPGVTNTLTAVKNAQLAQSPLVLLGGATATMLRGRGSLQDIDQMALIAPHVKWSARPNRLSEVVPALERAFQVAQSGVPGPVFVELAVDLLYDESIVREWYSAKTDKPDMNLGERLQAAYIRWHLRRLFGPGGGEPQTNPMLPAAPTPGEREIGKAAAMLAAAERPVMILGSQTMLHPDEGSALVAAVERLGIPVYLSGMARGLLGKDHPLQCRHKRRVALRESDLTILCGVPCDFRLDYGAHVSRTRVIAVNRCAKDLRKNRRPDLGVLGDAHLFLMGLADAVGQRPGTDRASWMDTLRARDEERNAEIRAMADEPVEYLNPLHLCGAIDRHLSPKSILVGDGGDFVATASYVVSPRGPYSWLDPGVFGTLGVGAGFALGAKLVHPEADVWLLYGDGAAGFSLMEVDTFARHGLPVIAVVGNDAGWTQIARDQVVILGDDVATGLAPMDYHGVGEACGGRGLLVDSPEEVEGTLANAVTLSRDGAPVVVNARIGATDFRKGSLSM